MGISLNPLMRNAVILALSDVGDGLAACALLLHGHEPSLVTDSPPPRVCLGCAQLCPVAVGRVRSSDTHTQDSPLSSLPCTLYCSDTGLNGGLTGVLHTVLISYYTLQYLGIDGSRCVRRTAAVRVASTRAVRGSSERAAAEPDCEPVEG